MSLCFYSLGSILQEAARGNGITPESVSLLILRHLIAEEENQ